MPENENTENYQPKRNKAEPILDERRTMSVPARTSDPPFSIVQRAQEIEKADESLQTQVKGKLDVILEQIQNLKGQAREIITQAELDMELHRIKCNFEKKPGQELHLYQKPDGTKYFSLLSFTDWQGNPPHEFLGSYLLNADLSYTETEKRPDISSEGEANVVE